jgi:hypothetical protein
MNDQTTTNSKTKRKDKPPRRLLVNHVESQRRENKINNKSKLTEIEITNCYIIKYSIFCVKIEPVDRPGSASSSHLNMIILELVITIIIIIMENYCRAILLLRVVTICVTATHACNMIIVCAKEAGDHSN